MVQAYLLTRLVTQTSTNQQYSNTPYNLFKNHIPNPKRLTSYPFLETYPPPKKKKKERKETHNPSTNLERDSFDWEAKGIL